MSRKKIFIIISILLLIIATIVGATYAYFSTIISGTNNVQADSKKYEIIYRGGDHITGQMPITSSKEDGKVTTVEIGLAKDSAAANANIYIQIESISKNLAISGFNWEVYRINGSNEIYMNSGNFAGKKSTDQVFIINDYELSETITKFKIYLWIDGNNSDSNITGGSFDGYIGANTNILTGIVKNS